MRQLRSFVQIVELGSITAAAERLQIAQPALSRQVQALEDELGVALLRRHGRGVVPTDEGRTLADRARQILDDVESMVRDVVARDHRLRGTVTLGLPPTVAEVLATPLVAETLRLYPEVKLRIVAGFSGHVQDWLQRGTIDIGVTYEGTKVPLVRSHPLLLERLFLIEPPGAPGTPVRLAEALSRNLILPSPDHGLRKLVDRAARQSSIELSVSLEVDILPTLLAFVERGAGSTILPLVSVFQRVNEGRLVARPIEAPVLDRMLVLWTPLNRQSTRLTGPFMTMLGDTVRRLVTNGEWPGSKL
ncbi:LysR family transcriptional regulator [Nitratireductor sp. ZSWI3]|uniref:LysR family transcriptional regulator n=1 Tax=Nitratireductor sp. ZSWI3 TaxID=2966359 RepID=UPI00214F6C64|nr:LysR family transcriptional regulator [Nitratireductor sp. ZSWI3]MCR4265288.1 LysR family transcriptional regulator [Nitratireductor sp. ZSWI3]